MNVVGPENLDVLSPKQNQKSIIYVNLSKEKKFSKVKGRTCADGNGTADRG